MPVWFKSYHSAELLRLKKILKHSPGFDFILIEYNNVIYRENLIKHLDTIIGDYFKLRLTPEDVPDYYALEKALFDQGDDVTIQLIS